MSTTSESTPRFELNVVQLVAAALAAITSAVVASFFGVAGTVIGAGIGSLVGTLGTAVYSHSLRRTQARLRGASRLVKVGGTERRHVRWQPVVVSTFLVFALAMAGITAAEAGFGRTMWSLVTGRHGSGQSTTIGQLAGTEPATTTPPPAPAATTPSFGPTATPRATREPTPTPARSSPSSEATATPAPAGTQPPEPTP